MTRRRSVAAVLLLILALSLPERALAHIGFGASQAVKIDGGAVSVDVRINWDHVEALILPRDGEAAEAGARVLKATGVMRGDRPCAGRVTRTLARMNTNILAVDLVFECPALASNAYAYTFHLQALKALGVHSLQYIEIAAGDRSNGFLRGPSADIAFDSKTLGEPPMIAAYFVLGFEHILFGLDHLAFLAALLLVAGRLRFALVLASAFAMTHALTLTLTALKIIDPNPNIVEPLIALSIAAAALESLRQRGRALPFAIASVFGLVHGMGFGAGLSEAGLPEGREALSVVSFTLGIETAQALLLAILFAALKALGRREKQARHALAVALAALGMFWFVERLAYA